MTEKLKEFSYEVLSEDRLRSHQLFNGSMVKDLLTDYHSGSKHHAAKIWNLMMFQIWWMRYFG